MTWCRWFAWHPVWTLSGRWVWLKNIQRRWNWDLNHWGDISGHSGSDGGWEYRLLPAPTRTKLKEAKQ